MGLAGIGNIATAAMSAAKIGQQLAAGSKKLPTGAGLTSTSSVKPAAFPGLKPAAKKVVGGFLASAPDLVGQYDLPSQMEGINALTGLMPDYGDIAGVQKDPFGEQWANILYAGGPQANTGTYTGVKAVDPDKWLSKQAQAAQQRLGELATTPSVDPRFSLQQFLGTATGTPAAYAADDPISALASLPGISEEVRATVDPLLSGIQRDVRRELDPQFVLQGLGRSSAREEQLTRTFADRLRPIISEAIGGAFGRRSSQLQNAMANLLRQQGIGVQDVGAQTRAALGVGDFSRISEQAQGNRFIQAQILANEQQRQKEQKLAAERADIKDARDFLARQEQQQRNLLRQMIDTTAGISEFEQVQAPFGASPWEKLIPKVGADLDLAALARGIKGLWPSKTVPRDVPGEDEY